MSTVNSVTSTGTAGSIAGSTTSAADTEDRFLKMLVAQMKNQDPLSPMDSAQVTAQMAQISTVSGIEKLNQTMKTLASGFDASQALGAATLAGHNVWVPGSSLGLASGSATGGFSLAAAADRVQVSVSDANGKVVDTVDLGATSAGMNAFQWDGNNGAAADGKYSFRISASAAGQPVTAEAMSVGRVAAIVRSNGATQVDLGALGVRDVADIRRID